jgi:DNA polymerase elongation subunit (family B)
MFFQPCSWIEQDINYKYTIDTYGRTHEGDIARVRLLNFKPYFYMKFENNDTQSNIQSLIKSPQGKQIDTKITLENKLDVINGFNNLLSIKVWKLEFSSLWAFKHVSKLFKNRTLFESNIPPYLRLFHEQDICPSSTIELKNYKEVEDSSIRVDKLYEVSYKNIRSELSKQIPLLILSYDIEVYSDSGQFPMSLNPKDEIIQIGLSLRWTDSLLDSVERYVLVSGTTIPSNTDDLKIISCSNECELLKKFQDIIYLENPDILIGYNTFGFDDGYISDRCKFNRISLNLGREDSLNNIDNLKTHKKTFELASGKYEVRYFDLPGRLTIDLLLSIRREQNLDSYKLDNVASTFLRDKVNKFVIITGAETRQYEIHTKSTRGLFAGNFVRFDIVTNTINPYADGKKFKVKTVNPKSFIVELDDSNDLNTFNDIPLEERSKLEWSFCKDDIDAKQMFKLHKGSAEDRTQIAKYCIQDCDLVLTLIAKLDTFVNACGMADVCKVPIDFIFLRGQGIKIYSAVLYYASKRNQIIQNQESTEEDMSYEGAIVLPPKIGMYLDQPIPVLDFNSLYPTNMIAFNISPDTLVYIKTYNSDGKLLSFEGIKDYSSELQIDEISYDISGGRKTCGFIQVSDSNPLLKGILPLTLDILLKKRKETRKLMESCDDESKISVLNGLQLAYKTVANSVYGQCGSRSSPIRKVEVAACTTAAGREKIYFAKKVVEEEFGGEIIYGDTDSIFIKFMTKSLPESISLAKQAAEKITSLCRKPYKIEYEKTFFPFIIFCRKRYIGLMYEEDITKCKRKFMGIALKRRDSAPIVKDVYGGALDILLEQRSLKNAQVYVRDMLSKLMENKFPLEKYVITKQLRDDYKNPGQIAHRVLADRMSQRDPGNKPQVGDRLAFVYIDSKKDEKKQGDRIEELAYVKSKNLKPDVEFYITNQIQNPLAQLFALGIDQIDGYKEKKYPEFPDLDEEEATLKVLSLKEKELDSLMFMGAQYLKKLKKGPMDKFFTRQQ